MRYEQPNLEYVGPAVNVVLGEDVDLPFDDTDAGIPEKPTRSVP